MLEVRWSRTEEALPTALLSTQGTPVGAAVPVLKAAPPLDSQGSVAKSPWNALDISSFSEGSKQRGHPQRLWCVPEF